MIQRFKTIKLDIRNTTIQGIQQVQEEVNGYVEKLEQNGYEIINEDVQTQTNSVNYYFLIFYQDKSNEFTKSHKGLRYTYKVYDNRNGADFVDKLLNEEMVRLEKEHRVALRHHLMPKTNTAFTQILIAHIPTGKAPGVVEDKKEKPVEKTVEKKEEVKEDVPRPTQGNEGTERKEEAKAVAQ